MVSALLRIWPYLLSPPVELQTNDVGGREKQAAKMDGEGARTDQGVLVSLQATG